MKCRAFVAVISVLSMLATGSAGAGIFHIRADGTATSKSDAVSCSLPSTAMNLDGYSNNSFSPGDTIVLCHEGGVFRSALYVGDGGASGAPITLWGRGTAVFSGSDLVSGWTLNASNVYLATFGSRPQQLFVDGVFGDRKSSLGELTNDLDWYWESNRLYLYSSTGDPDTRFITPGVEAGARDVCFGFGGQSHLIFDGLTARHANASGFMGWNPGSHIILRNSTAEWNWHVGFDVSADQPYGDVTIEDNIARSNGTGGITLLGPGRNSAIRRNQCYRNGKYQSDGNNYETQHQWTFGIKLWENTGLQEGNQIYFNECFDNGRDQGNDFQGMGVGIWLDGVPGNPENLNVVRHNLLYDNKGNGVFIEISSNSLTLGNVLFNNATNSGGGDEFTPANIVVDAREDFVSENNLIYNNTAVGGRVGMKIVTYDWQGCSVDNNIVENNIFVGASEHNLFVHFGGDNDGVNGIGNVYEHNNFGAESDGFIRWAWDVLNTYQEWDAIYGQPTDSVAGDPLLAGASPFSLYLTPGSPCIDDGADLGQAFDQGLLYQSTWTDSVFVGDQDSYGSGWDVGAYLYFSRVRHVPPPVERMIPGGFEKTRDLTTPLRH